MTDDQTVASMRFMPEVRRHLARQGTTFTNSFVTYPLCCPSRASFLTGQYTHNNGVLLNAAPTGGWEAFRRAAPTALPAALQQAGYHTGHFGKALNEYGIEDPTEVMPGWDEWEAMVDRPARNRYYGFRVNHIGRLRTVPVVSGNHNTDYFSRRVQRYIRQRAADDQPFFANLWLFAPHGERGGGPTIPAARHVGAFAREPLPAPPSLNEEDVTDKPLHLQRPPLSDATLARVERLYRWRLESLLAVDEAVGDIVATLETTGLLSNTLIVFTSDNGYHHGEHRIATGKWHVYDESTRVPLVVRGPDVHAGSRVHANVANIDVAPTLLDYAQASPLNVPDGRTLRPLLTGATTTFDRDVLLTTGYSPARRWYTAIRTDDYLYVEHVQDEAAEQIAAEELYDLHADPYQLHSLHDDPGHDAVRNELRDRLHRLRTCAGESCHSRDAMPRRRGPGGTPVPAAQIYTAGPVDDPELYPEFFSPYDDAEPTPEPHAARARVSLTADRTDVEGLGSVAFSAATTLDGASRAGVVVRLQRLMRGTEPWTDVATAITGDDGVAAFTVQSFANAGWRAVVPPATDHTRATSNRVGVTARARISSRLSDRVAARRQQITVRGAVLPARRGHTVVLQRRVQGRWVTLAQQQLDARSRYSFTVRAPAETARYRVRKPATRTLAAGNGPVRTLRVRMPRS